MVALLDACRSQELKATHLSPSENSEFLEILSEGKQLSTNYFQLWKNHAFPEVIYFMTPKKREMLINLSEISWEDESQKMLIYITRNVEEDKKDNGEDSSSSSQKQTLAEKLASQEKRRKSDSTKIELDLASKHAEVEAWIRNLYVVNISSGDMDEKDIQALVYVLARVNCDLADIPKTRTPSRLYDWATVNSSITMPFLSLKDAAKNAKFDKGFDLRSGWGFVDGKVIFPRKESLDNDESFWGRLADLLAAMKLEVIFSAINSDTVPDLSGSTLAKNNYFGYVFIRLVELFKSPSSATIRTGTLSALDKAKNDVDYVLLHYIYNKEKEKYKNLSLSPDLHQSQRRLVVSRTVAEAGKTTIVQSHSYVGYALAESLSLYVEKKVGKSPEAEPFFRFIHEIIQKLALKTDDKFVIPKAFFSPSNVLLRKDLRHGPDVTSKKGTRKGNTYVPFSFAKSLECQDMPETLRKTLTGVGATVSKQIDSINHLDILAQNQVLPDARRYVSLCYALSDDLRKKWQLNAEVIEDIASLNLFTEHNIVTLIPEDRVRLLNTIAKYVCETVPLYSDSLKQKSVQDRVHEVVDQKKKSREKRLPLRN